jgi:hypothetical protein
MAALSPPAGGASKRLGRAMKKEPRRTGLDIGFVVSGVPLECSLLG